MCVQFTQAVDQYDDDDLVDLLLARWCFKYNITSSCYRDLLELVEVFRARPHKQLLKNLQDLKKKVGRLTDFVVKVCAPHFDRYSLWNDRCAMFARHAATMLAPTTSRPSPLSLSRTTFTSSISTQRRRKQSRRLRSHVSLRIWKQYRETEDTQTSSTLH